MSSPITITFGDDGQMQAVYCDELRELIDLDPRPFDDKVRRASHVEPGPDGWVADLSPVDGPTLGPFADRQAALDAEVEWLHANGY